jgi:hypothetical protein
MEAMMAKPTVSPLQNIGQFFQGASRACGSQMLRYGLRTMSGNTGGFRAEALAKAAAASAATMGQRHSFMAACEGDAGHSMAEALHGRRDGKRRPIEI